MVRALEDRVKPGRLTCNRRPGPARGLGVPRRPSPAAPVPRAGPRAAGRPSPSCSPPALRGGGGAATIYIQGKPAELAPRPWTRPLGGANGAGAQPSSPRGRGPRSGQSGPQERGAGQQRDAPSEASPTPPSPARTWSQDCSLLPVSHHLPEQEIVPRCLLGWMPGIRICYSRSC